MEPRISLVTLGVADMAASRRFYEGLGWRASSISDETVTFFQAGGMVLGLYGREALAADANLSPEGSGFRGVALAHNVRGREEVALLLDQARAHGGTVLKAARDTDWGGHAGYFADPDGHVWEVAWNPGFELLPDGSLRLPE